ncbi:Polyvinyl alcohol dehydrogenase (cytochrome) [Bertholletia excelsa]
MAEGQKPKNPPSDIHPSPSTSSTKSKVSGEIGYNGSAAHRKYPNPPELTNPDPATLREQWRYAIKQYSKWYSHAWGTAIFAGLSFFALGWIIKGSNPLPSFVKSHDDQPESTRPDHDTPTPPVPATSPKS